MEKSPDAFRTISEVAEILETPAHVLRFWESRFPQIRPVKRAGGRRYYRPADVALLTGIKRLLHDEGMTIRGVQKILREQGVRHVSGMADETSSEDDDAALEAALIASSGTDEPAPPLAPAEAESAQIIALESALGDRAAGREPKADPDESSPAAPVAAFPAHESVAQSVTEDAKEDAAIRPSDDDGISDLVSRMVASVSAEESNTASLGVAEDSPTLPFEDLGTDSPPAEEHATAAPDSEKSPEEAPMALWAEDESEDQPKVDVPTLRVTRIGATSAAERQPPRPEDVPEPVAAPEPAAQMPEPELGPTLAARLRNTLAADLSETDRNSISVIRARARSLRDRLTSPIRSGH